MIVILGLELVTGSFALLPLAILERRSSLGAVIANWGWVFLGNLLEIGAFKLWRDVREFEKVSVDPESATVTWEGGIRLDPEILYQDLATRGGR